MEHRYGDRASVAGAVGVYCRSAGWFAARLVNMSTRGALLALERHGLRPHTPISVAFRVDRRDRCEWQLLRAVVVRHAPTGIGIEYLEHHRRCAQVLCCVIEYGCRSPFAARPRVVVNPAVLSAGHFGPGVLASEIDLIEKGGDRCLNP